jgi:hypothetical protein
MTTIAMETAFMARSLALAGGADGRCRFFDVTMRGITDTFYHNEKGAANATPCRSCS